MNVSNTWKAIQISVAAAGGVISSIFGELDVFLKALIILMVFDYVTGVIVAIINKKLSSAVGFKGIAKKVLILILVAVGQIVDSITGLETFRTMVICFYLTNEGVSILENCVNIGLPVPAKLKQILEQIGSDAEKRADEHINNDDKDEDDNNDNDAD